MSDEWKFTASDFASYHCAHQLASIANEQLAEWLAAAPVVYGVPNCAFSHAQGELGMNGGPDTHTARLVMIEPIRKQTLEDIVREFINDKRLQTPIKGTDGVACAEFCIRARRLLNRPWREGGE